MGIQCVKKKEIEPSLLLREQIRVDPFQSKGSSINDVTVLWIGGVQRICDDVRMKRMTKRVMPNIVKNYVMSFMNVP